MHTETLTPIPSSSILHLPPPPNVSYPLGIEVGFGNNDNSICHLAVADKHFGAVDDPTVAVLHGRCGDTLQVAARTRLCHGDGSDNVARTRTRKVALLLLLCPVVMDVRENNV